MFDHFQTEHDRKASVFAGQVVVTGTVVQLQMGIGLVTERYALFGRIDADDLMPLGAESRRDGSVAAAKVKNSPAFLMGLKTCQYALHGREQVAMRLFGLRIFPVITGIVLRLA